MKTYHLKLKYSEGDYMLEGAKYGNGTLAIRAHGDTPASSQVLSVNLEAYGLVPSSDRQFYAKDYGEHEGLADVLVDAGIATKGPEVRFGYGVGYLMTLCEGVELL